MTHDEYITEIVNQLKDNHDVIFDFTGDEFESAILELTTKGLIERGQFGYSKRLTKDGLKWAYTGLPYSDWINRIDKPNIHIGHNITGKVQRSDLKINLPIAPQSSKNAHTKPKPSIIEKFYWIAGIITAIILLYEFVIKHIPK